MKNYIAPEMEIVKFSVEDIMTASSEPASGMSLGGNEDNGYTRTIDSGAYKTF